VPAELAELAERRGATVPAEFAERRGATVPAEFAERRGQVLLDGVGRDVQSLRHRP